jgi:hypothetical protein
MKQKDHSGRGKSATPDIPVMKDSVNANEDMVEAERAEEERETETKFGIVAMIDVLGAKNFTIKDSLRFIKKRDESIERINAMSKNYLSPLNIIPDLDIATFGDTIIICWPIKNDDGDNIHLHLMGMFHLMKLLMVDGITDQFFYRGSIAVGEYIQYDNAILGPAVSDAAMWYENADWFGIFLTPNCEFVATYSLFEENKHNKDIIDTVPIESLIVKYPVPIGNSTQDFFSIPWPVELLFLPTYVKCEITPKAFFALKMSIAKIPIGTESKYYNSLAFFEWYRTEIFPKIEDRLIKLYPPSPSLDPSV